MEPRRKVIRVVVAGGFPQRLWRWPGWGTRDGEAKDKNKNVKTKDCKGELKMGGGGG